MNVPLRVGILAGESSGDILGAGLMKAIRAIHPEATFEGIGGPLMIAEGFESHVPMERLSVMGLEPLGRLPELLRIRKNLKQYFIKKPPDVFIGIDSPDFNLSLEASLRKAGITTVHYVSPSVWAWRQKRIKKIAGAVDMVLTLFPFELEVYRNTNIPATCVGHTLADEIPLENNLIEYKSRININKDSTVLALLPGSRQGEIRRLLPDFLETASLCRKKWPGLVILLPCANAAGKQQVEEFINPRYKDLDIRVTEGDSREVLAATDLVLIASGTATLEALLFKKPMVVCYRMGKIAYAIISRMLKVPYFSLPNLLAGRKLVDELVQGDVNAENIFSKLLSLQENRELRETQIREFTAIHHSLKQGASEKAAAAVLKLAGR